MKANASVLAAALLLGAAAQVFVSCSNERPPEAAAQQKAAEEPLQKIEAPKPEPPPLAKPLGKAVLSGNAADVFFIGGDSYRAEGMAKGALISVSLKAANSSAPLFANSNFIVWGEGWARLLDQGSLKKRQFSTEAAPDGKVLSKLYGLGGNMSLSGETLFQADSARYDYKLEALAEIPKVIRASVEIDPPWEAVSGCELKVEAPDGATKTLSIPKESTKDGKYETIFSGMANSFSVMGVYGAPSAGFELEGPFYLSLEQTGKRFRWHIGAPVQPGLALRKGESLSLRFVMRFVSPPPESLPEEAVEMSADLSKEGAKVSPYIFGAQLSRIGYGVKTDWAESPFQNNPKRDPAFKKMLEDSGIAFFRIYLHSIYDSYVEKDPICPQEGAACDYTRADPLMEALTEMGIEVVPCVGLYCPPWLSTQRKSPKYSGLWMTHRAPPKDNAKWAKIIAGMVRHFNVERKYGVKLWQVGNEPDDWTRYWVGGTLPEFVEYFNAASKAMKEADPSIRISGPDLANLYAKAWPEGKLDWKDEFVKACKGSFDDFSFNCYHEWDFSKRVKDARETLSKYGAESKSLYIAEYNLTAGDYDNISEFNFDGAIYVSKALKSLMDNAVDRASFYSFNRGSLALYGQDGDKPVPYPSYHAFRMHASLGRFKGGRLISAASSSPKAALLACRHEDGKGYSAVVTADSPFTLKYRVKLAFPGGAGVHSMKEYLLAEGQDGLKELPEQKLDLKNPIELKLPGRAVCLLVFRRD